MRILALCSAAALAAAAVTSTAGSPAFANLLPPGSPPGPPDMFGSISGTVVASILNAPFATATSGGTYSTEVLRTSGGTLDFLIQATNSTPPQAVSFISTASYPASIIPDTGYLTTGSTAGDLTSAPGDVAPSLIRRDTTGVASFDFPLFTGETTDVLVLETTATTFTSGTVSFGDGTTDTEAGFAPTLAPVPVPKLGTLSTLFLLGAGLAALELMRRRKPSA